ncbi:MAG: leucine-rich repeat protein [Lachnospiraceae bacterium]|nr:leucine-rich repeat protein [Lachnospiraceae bacterium]
MKKWKKNLLHKTMAVLLSLTLLLGMVAVPIEANAEAASGDGWVLADDGILTIETDTGIRGWYGYILTNSNRQEERDKVKKVVIEDGVTMIWSSAFTCCTNLLEVELPDSLKIIEMNAFSECRALQNIRIPDSVTEIGNGAFQYTAITEINIPRNITSIGSETFSGTDLKEVIIPEGVTYIGEMAFMNCQFLEKVTIPEGVQEIGDQAFLNCRMKEVTIPGSVTKIGDHAFLCDDLEKVTMLGSIPPESSGSIFGNSDYGCAFVVNNTEGIHVPAGAANTYKAAWIDYADYIAGDPISEEDQAAIDAVVEKVGKIPDAAEVTDIEEYKKVIGEARSAYDSLTDAQKALMPAGEYKKLTDAEAEYDRLKEEEENREKANEVITKINGIGTVTNTADSKKKIEEARSAYDSLTDVQKALVSEQDYKKLTDAEAKYEELIVQSVVEKIKAIGKETAGSEAWKQKIEEARAAYDSLSDELKEKITAEDVKELTDAEAEYDRLKEEEDQEKANEVITKINGIGTVTNTADSKKKIEEARSAYDSLTDAQKALVSEQDYKKLTDAEAEYEELIVQSVVEKIKAIGKETAGSEAWKQKIEEARAAYDSLSDELKEKITAEDVKELTDAGAEYDRLKQEEKDKVKANEVIAKINGIGAVTNTADSKKKIEEARSAYNSLTDTQKALVPEQDYKKLTDAEAAYQKLVQGEGVVTPPVSDPLAGLTEEQRQQVREIMEKLNVSVETAIKVQKLGDELKVDLDVLTLADEAILNEEKEGDIKGSSFSKIQARAVKATKSTVSLKWNKVKGADGYQVYGAKCGKKNKYKELKNITKNSTVKYTQKKLKKGTAYRYVVKAYKVVDGKKITIAISKTIHESTEGGKKENLKEIKVNKTNVKIKKGKKFTVKAKEVKKKGSAKKLLKHRKVCYESSNPGIATVSKKGVIKGKQKGSCIVWVYGQNGMYKKIKVKVS